MGERFLVCSVRRFEASVTDPLLRAQIMRAPLLWHAREESEYKAVAYDVLQAVAPGYALRVAGMVMASATLIGFWSPGTAMLLRQEKALGWRETLRQLRAAGQENPVGGRVFIRGPREYLRRDFPRWQTDNLGMARAHLARVIGATAA